MSDDAGGRLATELRYRTFRAARVGGGLCANCGRVLAEGETVWLERIPVPDNPKALLRAPVGRECASPAFLARAEGREPERCAGCGRGVHYGDSNPRRRQALCSIRCRTRAIVAKQQRTKE